MSTIDSLRLENEVKRIDLLEDQCSMPDLMEFQQAYEQCDQAEIQKFENEFLANHKELSDAYAEVMDQVDGRSLSELFQSYKPERSINGSEMVDQLRSEAEKKIYVYDGICSSIPIDNPQKDILLRAADQLEQYLKDLGTDGMCSDEDLKMFWQDTRMMNGSEIIDQLRSSAEAMDKHITYDGMSYGENPQRKALLEAADKLEQYVNDLGTGGMCSNEDLEIFWKNFLSKDENPYQASGSYTDDFNQIGDIVRPSYTDGNGLDAGIEQLTPAWAIKPLTDVIGDGIKAVRDFWNSLFGGTDPLTPSDDYYGRHGGEYSSPQPSYEDDYWGRHSGEYSSPNSNDPSDPRNSG